MPAELIEALRSGDWDRFEALVRDGSDAELESVCAPHREEVVAKIFEHYYDELLAGNPGEHTGVVHWHVRSRRDRGDYFQLVLSPGSAVLGRTLDEAPTCSIAIDPVRLLRVVSEPHGSADHQARVEGDRRLAAALGYG